MNPSEGGYAASTCPTCGSRVTVYTGDEGTSSYEPLLDAERRALAYQEFVAYTLDEFGHLLSSQWKAHARSVLSGDA